MDAQVAALRNTLSQTPVILVYDRITRLPPACFSNRRLYLPCITFPVKKLNLHSFEGGGSENGYRARVSGIGHVEFQTSDRLSLSEPRRLVFVHPWIRDPPGSFSWGGAKDEDSDDSDQESNNGGYVAMPLTHRVCASITPGMDEYTRALQMVVRLQHPFPALLLQEQHSGEFKRVAAEQDIIVPGIDRAMNFARDIHTGIVEIL